MILVIVDYFLKIIYYEPVKVLIDTTGLAKVITNTIIRHHSLPDSTVSNRGPIFTSKFCFSLYYSLSIKQKLSTALHLQIDSQTERQNSTMEAYLLAYINYE